MALSGMIWRSAGPSADGPRHDILETEAAVCAELDEIERRRQHARSPYQHLTNPCGETLRERTTRLDLTALCLSGGGIRSAAFSLGVLQALAKMRLLNEFDYLSTVSGGGFIGGWLQVLIRESGDVKKAQEQLAENNARPLHRLRGFTNYLTPQTGPLSADVWAGIVLYLRNLALNWMVFAPLFMLAALAPIFYRTLIAAFREISPDQTFWSVMLLVAIASVSLAVSAWQGCVLLPSHRSVAPQSAQTGAIIERSVLPALVWALIAPIVVNDLMYWNDPKDVAHAVFVIGGFDLRNMIVPGSYAASLTAGYLIAWLTHTDPSDAARALYRKNATRWLYATACSTAMIALAIYLIQPGGLMYRVSDWLGGSEQTLATFGPLWFIGTHVYHTTFYVAFRKEAVHADLDREWLARLSGCILMTGVVWTAFAVSVLVLPVLFAFTLDGAWHPLRVASTGTTTTILGAVGAWLGKKFASELDTAGASGGAWTRWVPNALAAVFVVGVFLAASSVLQPTLGSLSLWWANLSLPAQAPLHVVIGVQVACAVVLFGLVMCFGRVNVNRFSMHAIYRNRLSRAFLGSARKQRDPDPFTGFDANDNPALADFLDPVSRQRLFPVVNMTLNVTSGSNAAWAERKAESFYATPLTVGSAMLRHPDQPHDDTPPLGAFVQTRKYAGMESLGDLQGVDLGPRLGSVLTISGAAVSPNWGYHSSTLTAFLMTLFNVRLGAWLPNPAVATPRDLQLAKPKNSVFALLCEMGGVTTDASQAVYLSDGGHFENLGLYEMLRRRCRRIVVIDAGQDGDCAFFDLGNAIRKARIDLNVEVTMPEIRIVSRKVLQADKNAPATALAIAIGSVDYPEGTPGKILYVKPSFLPHLPADVLAYGRSDDTFPHDSTAEQWFTESQFESYRALGRWHFNQLESKSLEALFKTAEDTVERVAGPSGPIELRGGLLNAAD